MGFGLGHGRDLDDAPGIIGVSDTQLPPLPDDATLNPLAGRLDPRNWFTHPTRPFEIEIGCGKGSFILETARAQPEVNFLGIEWAREFYLYASDRVRRAQLGNVRMLRTDASEFLRWRCNSEIASVVHLYYSDPWPKRKHHKNRVVQHRFLAQVHRILTPGGQLRIVTDHDELWQWDQAHFDIWTNPDNYMKWCNGTLHNTLDQMQPLPTYVPPIISNPDSPGCPFTLQPFIPPSWVGEGEVVGTNYERKFTDENKRPHSAVLVKQ
jgi:tRNA (guanine-N7-)-methyltransferase